MRVLSKIGVFFLLIVAGVLAGAMYGCLHDQLTYTISPEYYFKFKFMQFDLAYGDSPRTAVALVGVLATWWMGAAIGILLGVIGFIHPDWRSMLTTTLKGFVVVMAIAFATGLVGLAYGYIFLADKSPEEFSHWFVPADLVDFRNFIAVGSMHNFSYLGGVLGLIGGQGYSVWARMRNRRKTVSIHDT